MSASTVFAKARAGHSEALKWAIGVTAVLAALLEVIDVSIVNVALSDMQNAVGATLSEIGWVITGYAMANVIIIPLTAWLGDYFGKRRYFVFSLIGFTLASVLCGLSSSLGMLIAARVLQGLCGGGLLAKAQAILFETFPREQQGMAQALFGVGVIAGPTIGPTLGGYIVTNWDWRWIFFINLPIGIMAVMMAMAFLPKDAPHRAVSSKVDWLGIGLLIVTLGSLQYMLEKGHDEGWLDSNLIKWLITATILGAIGFIWRETTVEYPAVNLKVLRYRSLAAGSAFSAVLGMSLYGALFAIPIFAQQILKFTALQTGLMLFPGALASAFMMPVVGKIVSKLDARLMVAVGATAVLISMLVLKQINSLTSEQWLMGPLMLRGAAMPLMFLPLSMATLGPLPKKDVAAGSGFYNLTRQLGGSVGIAVMTTILANRIDFHRAILGEHISQYSTPAMTRIDTLTNGFIAKGADAITAKMMAYKALSGTVSAQASVQSFGDLFYFVAICIAVSLPLVFLLGKGSKAQVPADAH